MKTPIKHILLLLLCFITAAGFSQSVIAKPKVFAQFPETISLSTETLNNSFAVPAGKKISLAFSKEFTVSGTVTSNGFKYNNLQSLTVLLPEYNNAVLHLSKIINEDKSITYTGRIISNTAGDGFTIQQDGKGNYALNKIRTETVLQDCFIH